MKRSRRASRRRAAAPSEFPPEGARRIDTRNDQLKRIWRLAEPRTLGYLIVLAVLVDGAAISPVGADLAASGSLGHYTQHGVIYAASGLLGGALRDLSRAWPFSARVVITLGALSFIGDIASLLPPFDNAIATNPALHEAQHGIVFLAGALMGLAVRDIAVLRRGPRPIVEPSTDPSEGGDVADLR